MILILLVVEGRGAIQGGRIRCPATRHAIVVSS
jgi:hypothetical protein